MSEEHTYSLALALITAIPPTLIAIAAIVQAVKNAARIAAVKERQSQVAADVQVLKANGHGGGGNGKGGGGPQGGGG